MQNKFIKIENDEYYYFIPSEWIPEDKYTTRGELRLDSTNGSWVSNLWFSRYFRCNLITWFSGLLCCAVPIEPLS